MTRFFPRHYNFNSKLLEFYCSNKLNNITQGQHINSDNNSNNNNGNNNNINNNSQTNTESDLIKQMVKQSANLDQQFKDSTILDDPIPKYVCEIAAQYQHKMATNNIVELISQNLIFSKVMVKYRDRVGSAILRFNTKAKHKVQYDPTKRTTHRDLIRLVVQFLLTEFYNGHTIYDSARLKCTSSNGALAWLNVAYNDIFGRKFTNRESVLSKSLVLRSKITNILDYPCDCCMEKMDCYGYHALSCPAKGMITQRHDAICDKLFDFCIVAKLQVQKEQRYQDDGNGGKIRIHGHPGDIKIINYFSTSEKPKDAVGLDLYIDCTVVNIFADTYINTSSKKRGELIDRILWVLELKY